MKKIIIVLGAIVSVFLMTSVVTAVPHMNSKTIVENNILLTDFEENLEKINKKISTPAVYPPYICALLEFLIMYYFYYGMEPIANLLFEIYKLLGCPMVAVTPCPCSSSEGG